jgi:hypothetical protein
MTPVKRGRGRPSLTGETGERYQVTIPPTVADKLRESGNGSLSAGIVAAGYRVPDKPKPPKQRYVVVTDPDEIEAVKRAGLRDPVGGLIDGKWYAEAFTLAQYRRKKVEIEV